MVSFGNTGVNVENECPPQQSFIHMIIYHIYSILIHNEIFYSMMDSTHRINLINSKQSHKNTTLHQHVMSEKVVRCKCEIKDSSKISKCCLCAFNNILYTHIGLLITCTLL